MENQQSARSGKFTSAQMFMMYPLWSQHVLGTKILQGKEVQNVHVKFHCLEEEINYICNYNQHNICILKMCILQSSLGSRIPAILSNACRTSLAGSLAPPKKLTIFFTPICVCMHARMCSCVFVCVCVWQKYNSEEGVIYTS